MDEARKLSDTGKSLDDVLQDLDGLKKWKLIRAKLNAEVVCEVDGLSPSDRLRCFSE
jgi:hypothetical protein